MELAWQKERESQKKLITELSTMSRDLKATLIDLETKRDAERLDNKRKLEALKKNYDDEQEDTKKQITELQYDLLELRDAHAKLRTTNDKLKRDKDKFERERDEFKSAVSTRLSDGKQNLVASSNKNGTWNAFYTTFPQRVVIIFVVRWLYAYLVRTGLFDGNKDTLEC